MHHNEYNIKESLWVLIEMIAINTWVYFSIYASSD